MKTFSLYSCVRTIRRIFIFLLFLSGMGLSSALICAQPHWPGWLGPEGNRSVDSGDYPVEWTAENVLWKVSLPGKASSTPIVWEDHIFLTSPAEGLDTVLAYDLSGNSLWKRSLGPETPGKHRALGSGSNASPVTDGEGVFVYFKSGNFAALELDGTVRWNINLVEQYGRERLFWDHGTSPVLTKDAVIMTRMHGGESWVAAFDKTNGDLKWKVPRNYDVPTENDNGYTTPLVIEHNNQQSLLLWGADHLTAHNARNGELVWSFGNFNPDKTGFWPAIATPAIWGNVAVVPVGRDDRRGQAEVHGIRLGGSGDVTETHRIWRRDNVGIFVPTPAVHKDRVFLLRHRGEVVCLDPSTGRTIWSESLPRASASYYSSPLIARDTLYVAREDGMVFVAKVEDKLELLAENDMKERIVASIVPIPGFNRLLIRGDEHLFCVGSK